MSSHIFLGPSLALERARRIYPAGVFHPPASLGDIYQLTRSGAVAVLIVDGSFDSLPPVWHKEILYALANGTAIAGCSSMGALRAAELASCGMVGWGVIFRYYRDGKLTDDDEVAVAHGPQEFGFRATSDAMVDIRHGVAEAVGRSLISAHTGRLVEACAKRAFYPDRNWQLAAQNALDTGADANDIARLLDFVRSRKPSLKAADAAAALAALAAGQLRRLGRSAADFVPTNAWRHFEQVFGEPYPRPLVTLTDVG